MGEEDKIIKGVSEIYGVKYEVKVTARQCVEDFSVVPSGNCFTDND